MKHLANWISISRIGAALALALVRPFSHGFFWLYSYCGISDALDGAVARRTHAVSSRGAVIDSLADIVVLAAVGFRCLPIWLRAFPDWTLPACLAVAAIRIAAYFVGSVKFRRFVSLHTDLNKGTGFLLFLLPYLWTLVPPRILAVVLCVIAGGSAAEELLCVIMAREYEPDLRSLWELGRRDASKG